MIIRRSSQGYNIKLYKNTTPNAVRTRTFSDGSKETTTYPTSGYEYFVEVDGEVVKRSNTFKNAGVAVGDSATTIYTAPASTTGVIHAVYLSNIDGTNDVDVDLFVTDTSAGSDFHIFKSVVVRANSTLVIEKPINLEAGDALKATASAASDLQAFASVLEIT